jgi:hypothetical protein
MTRNVRAKKLPHVFLTQLMATRLIGPYGLTDFAWSCWRDGTCTVQMQFGKLPTGLVYDGDYHKFYKYASATWMQRLRFAWFLWTHRWTNRK